MRIIYSLDYLEGGTFHVAEPLARALQAQGHEVRIVQLSDELSDEEVDSYDLIHAWNARASLRFRHLLPTVQTINSFVPQSAALYREAARAATIVHTHSPFVAQFLWMHEQVTATFIPTAIDPARLGNCDIPLPGQFTLGWLGSDRSFKRFDVARAIAERAEVPYVQWDVDALHPWEKVRDEFFPAISCYLLTSWNDAGPLPPQEALAYGRPVISTAVGMMNMIVRDGINGLIFDGSIDMGVLAVREMQANFDKFKFHALVEELTTPLELLPQYMRLYKRALKA